MISGDFLTRWNATGEGDHRGKGEGKWGEKRTIFEIAGLFHIFDCMYILLPYGNMIFSILFVLFSVQNLCCNDFEYHSLNWKDVSVKNIDISSVSIFSLAYLSYHSAQSFFYFSPKCLLVSVCTKGFAYLLCSPRGRGIGLLVCTRRLSFHEFYNCLLLKLNFFLEFLPTTFTYTRPTTHDI